MREPCASRDQDKINGRPDKESGPKPVPRQPKRAKKEGCPAERLPHERRLGNGLKPAALEMNRVKGHRRAPFGPEEGRSAIEKTLHKHFIVS